MGSLIPPDKIGRLCGFGMAECGDGYLFRPTSIDEIQSVFALAKETSHQVVLRAAGRSYGDAAILNEGIVVDLSEWNQVLSWDREKGIIEAGPGITLEHIWQTSLPDGWWLPVVSGTMKTSLGGALAMNIHGKNNLLRGTIGEHVLEIELLLVAGEKRVLTPKDELFYAVIGGAGLLGVIIRIKLQMKRVKSGMVRVEAVSCRNWDEQFQAFEGFEGKAEYVVSWVDMFGSGSSAGRGILHAGWHDEEPAASLQLDHQILPAKIAGFFPKSSVWRILRLFNNRPGMRFVNAAKHLSGKMREDGATVHQSLAAYNFLLDYVPGWEKAYLPGGLIQCQFFVPRESAPAVFAQLGEMQQERKMESFLGVMKRHRPDRFLLSHAVDGYSLALDFKVTASNKNRLWDLANDMNQLALDHGGRFYFAKDATLTAAQAHEFLGSALTKFRELKQLYDPEGLLTSELAKRLELS